MNFKRCFGVAFYLSTIFSILSLADGSNLCGDTLPLCHSYRELCNFTFIRNNCNLTCGICQIGICADNNGGCNQLCDWTGNETRCSCFPGYRLATDNYTCEDINECTDGPNPCSPITQSHCVNTVGSYSCQKNVCSNSTRKMNYYRSRECCTVTNGSCGLTVAFDEILARAEPSPLIRVSGGIASAYFSWPWQAQILHEGFHHCGASLIANQWLIGAAHCFENHSYQNMLVYLGHIRGAPHIGFVQLTRIIIRSISNVIVPDTASGIVDDIALIELLQPVTFSDNIRPICLPRGEEPSIGTKCWATGFGSTETSQQQSSNLLREVDMPVVDRQVCMRVYQGKVAINERILCAGYADGRKDTCLGDSGGPLACQRSDSCQWYLSGVTSSGIGCALPGSFSLFTNVASYEGWLREIFRERNVTQFL